MDKSPKKPETPKPILKHRALFFLNKVQDAEELHATIQDDPKTGNGKSSKGIGIGERVAQRILQKRYSLPGGRFSDWEQLQGIPGLGKDKLHDLLYTVSLPEFQEKMRFSEAEEKLRSYKATKALLHHRLSKERKSGTPQRHQLEQKLNQWVQESETLAEEIYRHKELAKRRKREIDTWKDWFYNLTADEQSECIHKLKYEIDWRAEELNMLTQKLSSIVTHEVLLRAECRMAESSLLVFEKGAYEGAVEDDPRMIVLLEKIEESEVLN